MTTTCFVSYEIHPTTRGGCGVLLRHAAEHLLRGGHEVVFLLDIPRHEFERFRDHDRVGLPNAEKCRAYHADTLADRRGRRPEECPCEPSYKAARFADALEELLAVERPDFVEFFEYCGVGHAALARRLYGVGRLGAPGAPVLGVRLHNSLELIDDFGGTRHLGRDRYHLYGLERATLRLAETVLTPTKTYFDAYYRDRYGIDPGRVVVSQSPKTETARVTRRPGARGPFTIAYVGRMFNFKGVDQLVHAGVELLRRRPDLNATFDIIGPDAAESPLGSSFEAYLRTLIPGALRGRFVFAGHLGHAEIVERLNDALFAVFPNKFESFCYALHEVYDAGVPVVINSIPGFADFFEDGRNALVYDGSTGALVAAMERMLDDGALRERLTRPYAVADRPLGDIYASPRALRPVAEAGGGVARVLAVVLAGADDVALDATLRAIRAQSEPVHRTIVLRRADPDEEESLWLLGRSWHARTPEGGTLAPEDLRTLEAVVFLRAGDAPAPGWHGACARALAGRADIGFAGAWARSGGAPAHSLLDVSPEVHPFERGSALTRTVVRTEPGRWLLDLLDPGLGALGEIGLVWGAVARHGHGVLLPEVLMELEPEAAQPPDANLLKYLLARYGGPFAARLALYAGLLHESAESARARAREIAVRAAVPLPEPGAEPSLEHKISVANELGGSLLAKMALEKFRRRLAGKAPPRG